MTVLLLTIAAAGSWYLYEVSRTPNEHRLHFQGYLNSQRPQQHNMPEAEWNWRIRKMKQLCNSR